MPQSIKIRSRSGPNKFFRDNLGAKEILEDQIYEYLIGMPKLVERISRDYLCDRAFLEISSFNRRGDMEDALCKGICCDRCQDTILKNICEKVNWSKLSRDTGINKSNLIRWKKTRDIFSAIGWNIGTDDIRTKVDAGPSTLNMADQETLITMMSNKDTYDEIARELKKTPATIRHWDNTGKIKNIIENSIEQRYQAPYLAHQEEKESNIRLLPPDHSEEPGERERIIERVQREPGERERIIERVQREPGEREKIAERVPEDREPGERERVIEEVQREPGERERVIEEVQREPGNRERVIEGVPEDREPGNRERIVEGVPEDREPGERERIVEGVPEDGEEEGLDTIEEMLEDRGEEKRDDLAESLSKEIDVIVEDVVATSKTDRRLRGKIRTHTGREIQPIRGIEGYVKIYDRALIINGGKLSLFVPGNTREYLRANLCKYMSGTRIPYNIDSWLMNIKDKICHLEDPFATLERIVEDYYRSSKEKKLFLGHITGGEDKLRDMDRDIESLEEKGSLGEVRKRIKEREDLMDALLKEEKHIIGRWKEHHIDREWKLLGIKREEVSGELSFPYRVIADSRREYVYPALLENPYRLIDVDIGTCRMFSEGLSIKYDIDVDVIMKYYIDRRGERAPPDLVNKIHLYLEGKQITPEDIVAWHHMWFKREFHRQIPNGGVSIPDSIQLLFDMRDIDGGLMFDAHSRYHLELKRLLNETEILCITGPGGTGKTHRIVEMIREEDKEGRRWGAFSFMGKSVSRLSEVLLDKLGYVPKIVINGKTRGNLPMTMHSCLSSDDIKYNTYYTVFIDEASTVDYPLLIRFLRKTRPRKLLMIGDDMQTRPISYGSPFKNLLQSDAIFKNIRHIKLDKIYRSKGLLTEFCLKLRNERKVSFYDDAYIGTLYMAGVYVVKRCIERAIDEGFRYHDITVVTPVKGDKGYLLGKFNDYFEDIFLRGKAKSITHADKPGNRGRLNRSRVYYGKEIYEGQRMMSTENDRDIGMKNGEEGTIELKWEGEDKKNWPEWVNGSTRHWPLVRRRDGSKVPLKDHMEKSSAMTVHKAQGSEWPCVIVFIPGYYSRNTTHSVIYTASSRAMERLFLVSGLSINSLGEEMSKYQTPVTHEKVSSNEYRDLL